MEKEKEGCKRKFAETLRWRIQKENFIACNHVNHCIMHTGDRKDRKFRQKASMNNSPKLACDYELAKWTLLFKKNLVAKELTDLRYKRLYSNGSKDQFSVAAMAFAWHLVDKKTMWKIQKEHQIIGKFPCIGIFSSKNKMKCVHAKKL